MKIKLKILNVFDIFKSRNIRDSKINDEKTIFYHEDDFRQVEIVPCDNLSTLKKESEKVDTFGKEHNDSSGFTDIYVRSDKDRTKLNQRRIDPNELEKIISSLGFDRTLNVLTGYGQNYRKQHKDCIAFGKDYSAVFYDFKDNIVEHIWFTNHWSIDRVILAKSLHDLGQKWNLLLQDWNLTVTVNLKDKNAIDEYLKTYDAE